MKESLPHQFARILECVGFPTVQKGYPHWEELRFRRPPSGLNHEEWWMGLKVRRQAVSRFIPLQDSKGQYFKFNLPNIVSDLLHQIDRGGGTGVEIPDAIKNPNQRDRYIMRSLMEEAITSSQLEGAATTRDVAKKMLAEGRKPKDQGERMIMNNFLTIQKIQAIKSNELTPEMVFEIHRDISTDALDIPGGAGRFRRSDEQINVSDIDGTIFHTPPPADELPSRLQAMCDFGNGKTPDFFVHPVIRGILLHFWLAYDHPFVDGNGRTARALFYWQMLHCGYWLFEFISISHYLRKAPIKYGTAFLHTETDENDLTYFIIHQAEIIRRAIADLYTYASRKSQEVNNFLGALQKFPGLNHRQQALISHALRHPGFAYTIAGHKTRHGIVYQTARRDLLTLAELGILEQKKSGHAFVFLAPKDLNLRLNR